MARFAGTTEVKQTARATPQSVPLPDNPYLNWQGAISESLPSNPYLHVLEPSPPPVLAHNDAHASDVAAPGVNPYRW
jgi:hypothetical protein